MSSHKREAGDFSINGNLDSSSCELLESPKWAIGIEGDGVYRMMGNNTVEELELC